MFSIKIESILNVDQCNNNDHINTNQTNNARNQRTNCMLAPQPHLSR